MTKTSSFFNVPVFFFVFVGSCASGPTQNTTLHATSIIEKVRTSGVLKVGTTGDYRPFTYRTPEGTYSGMDIQLAKDLASQLGVKLEFIQTSWKSLATDLQGGKFDIAMGGISITDERHKRLDF